MKSNLIKDKLIEAFTQKDYDLSIKEGLKRLKKNKRDTTALQILSASYGIQKKYQMALKFSLEALKYSPNNPSILNNLGMAYINLQDIPNAIKYFIKSITLNNSDMSPYITLSKIYLHLEKIEESNQVFEKLESLNLNDPYINFSKGIHYLKLGEYKKGFDLFRHRYNPNNSKQSSKLILENNILTNTNEIKGASILIYKEQGLGDTLQFIRYIELLHANNAQKIIVYVQKPLEKILKFNFQDKCEIVTSIQELSISRHCIMMDLPYVFSTEVNSIPLKQKYITVDATDSFSYKKKYILNNNNKNIAIVWRGNPSHTNDIHRSISLRNFLNYIKPFLNSYNVYALQYDINKEEIKLLEQYNITSLASGINDFYDTAVILDNIDILISVDTSIVHLAGAMGRKTYLLLPLLSDWRWGLSSNNIQWYDSVLIYRQTILGDWKQVFTKIMNDL